MREATTTLVRRGDYAPPAFWIRTVDLSFDLDPVRTMVCNTMRVERNAEVPAAPLRLDGDDIVPTRVMVDGTPVSFRQEHGQLVIDKLPAEPFTLEIRNTCSPEANSQLSGLYTSGGGFFTQCEAEGFRRITYFLDRPDVMAVYTVLLRANRTRYPVLLSNGNLLEQGELADGRHFAKWHDPFPKPCYLFALVAADLVARRQRIRTRSGKDHLLEIYVRRGDLDKTEHAMNSLIASIVWDEARFGLPLDLERFMIVAVEDYNSGAMENKGLNLFNTKYVLASPATATDENYADIESVVGHEYFHNWTGNRITCRDWFQLSLKEGLTVFRDQEFSMDMAGSASARAVKRISDVRFLREAQFAEDAGPMAHPVRPDSYAEINNFYTTTVYEKGAEVVRMMATLVGRDGFARGMKLYFERFDGQAVTCDDFAQAIADANPASELARTLPAFKRWYSQAGTPRLVARGRHDAAARQYTLEVEQPAPDPAGAAAHAPQVIPIALGLVDRDGRPLPLHLEHETPDAAGAGTSDRVLVLDGSKARFVFTGIDAEPVPSLLRGFSAPVLLDDGLGDADRLVLLEHDSDPFNRWEAAQRLALARLLAAVDGRGPAELDPPLLAALRAVLRDPALDPAFKDLVLTLPAENYIAEQAAPVDPPKIHAARMAMLRSLARALRSDWEWAFETHQVPGPYAPDPVAAGRRALANRALSMIALDAVAAGDRVWPGRIHQRFEDAPQMTERLGALRALVLAHAEPADVALESFHAMFRAEPLVIDTWFALQATAPERDGQIFERVRRLLGHPDFSLRNPNRARSLLSGFCQGNPGALHRADGAGVAFWADHVIALDAMNPQFAARLARVLDRWAQLAEPYRGHARAAIERVAAQPALSGNVREIVTSALKP